MAIKKELTVDELIKKEVRRLRKIFANIDKDKLSVSLKLIDNASFMSVQLDFLQRDINRVGTVTDYRNGENQYGTKKNPDVDTYNQFIKQYTTIIKQLIDLLPKTTDDTEDLLAGIRKPT